MFHTIIYADIHHNSEYVDIELGSEETIPPVEDFNGTGTCTFVIKRRGRKLNAFTFYLYVLIQNDKYIKYITVLFITCDI